MANANHRLRSGTFCAVALGIGCLAGGPPALAQAVVNGPAVAWDFATHTPQSAGSMAGIKAMADAVNAGTGGKFTIKFHWGGTLTPVRETVDALGLGAFQMGLVPQSFHPGKIPTTNIFDLPFLQFGNLSNQVRAERAYFNLPEVVADAARWNIRILMPALLTPYELSGKGKPPARIDDLKGMRIRAFGGLAEALKTVGVVPSNIPSPEMYGALERGIVDGLVLPAYAHSAYRTQELVTWYTTSMDLGTISSYASINLRAWNGLPAEYRKLMEDVVDAAQERGIPVILADDKKVLDEFKERKLQHVVFSKAERDKLIEIGARPVWNKWVVDMNAAGYPGQKLLDFLLAEAGRATN